MSHIVAKFELRECPTNDWARAIDAGCPWGSHPNDVVEEPFPLRGSQICWLKGVYAQQFKPSMFSTYKFILAQAQKFGYTTEPKIGMCYYLTVPGSLMYHDHVDEGHYFETITRYMAFLTAGADMFVEQLDQVSEASQALSILQLDARQPYSIINKGPLPWTFLVFDIYK